MPTLVGTRLGPYEILAPIGAGGMGEVYKARDTRLDRVVAIKVSKEKFSERFEREARAVAALNHPHICQIYDVGPDYLVMEYIEGSVLKGPLPLAVALRYGAEICDALDAAHKKGITHRDLKPANILVTKAGVKLLDFGLAKTKAAVTAEEGTMTMALTGKGEILGTLQYMSPEQLQGHEAGPPSDLFSFGLVLYEMLTGKRAFDAASPASVIAAILERDAPSVAGVAPASLDRVLRRCLEKDPERRWHSAHDVKMQLEPVVEEPARSPVGQRRLLPWIVAAVLASAVVALGLVAFRHATEQPRTLRFSVLPPDGAALRLDSIPAMSPDGRSLAFVANTTGKNSLWVRDLDSLTSRQLAGTEGADHPFWSPDSHTIAFFAKGKLKKIDAAGGPTLTLCDGGAGGGGSWNKNDVIVFLPEIDGGLSRVPAGGGSATPVTTLDRAAGEVTHRYPWFLPDGRHFLYSTVSFSRPVIYVADLDSNRDLKTRRLLVAASSNAVFTQPGYLLFLREQTLLAQPFDAGRAQTTGDPIPIAEQVDFLSNRGQGEFSASRDGVLAYRSGGARKAQLTWFDRSGRMQGMVGPPGTMQFPAISPDSGSVMIDRLDPDTGFYDLWWHDLARNTSARFTKRGQSPVWSPDGKKVAFTASGDGRPRLYQKALGGTGQDEVLDKSERRSYPEDWARDGRYLIETVQDPNTTLHIWVLPITSGKPGDRKPFPYLQSEFNQWQAKLSPDGRWLAYQSNETSPSEIYVQSFPTPGQKSLISTNGGAHPAWSRDGKELFFIGADRKLMATAVQTGTTFKAGVPKPLFETRLPRGFSRFDVSKDGRFLIPTEVDSGSGAAINIIVNWTAGLKK